MASATVGAVYPTFPAIDHESLLGDIVTSLNSFLAKVMLTFVGAMDHLCNLHFHHARLWFPDC